MSGTDRSRAVLLTGATGALGQEVLRQLLETRPARPLVILARGGKGGSAERRVKAIIRKLVENGQAQQDWEKRVEVLDGDMSEPHLGLQPCEWQTLTERVEQIIHCAAAVRFDQPLVEARQINLEGTRQAIELAKAIRKQGGTGRLDYIGTAYVAGKRTGVAYENELVHRRGFRNTYEQTKYEAELLVRQAMTEVPVCIQRPSIIIGNSRTGETSNFKAFYWPIRVYAAGQMRVLPAVASCRVDLVPVDYVAAAVVHLSQQEAAIGQTYHLTAGRDNLITVGEIAEAAIKFFGVKPPRLINPAWLGLVKGPLSRYLLDDHTAKTLKLGEPYYPYLSLKLEFDNAQTAHTLQTGGICAPSVRDFFDNLFRYCVETDWGRKAGGRGQGSRVGDVPIMTEGPTDQIVIRGQPRPAITYQE